MHIQLNYLPFCFRGKLWLLLRVEPVQWERRSLPKCVLLTQNIIFFAGKRLPTACPTHECRQAALHCLLPALIAFCYNSNDSSTHILSPRWAVVHLSIALELIYLVDAAVLINILGSLVHIIRAHTAGCFIFHHVVREYSENKSHMIRNSEIKFIDWQ
jgi:hypothetical protein